tara:strand:+ start:271 stop:711 length:441 start_codon:yes stop_codon:yes gene_type:complete
MAKAKTKRRRSRNTFRILNALEALAYGQIISVGLTGGGLYEFVTGKQDLMMKSGSTVYDSGFGGVTSMSSATVSGTDIISLKDMIAEPTLAVAELTNNFSQNIVPMATAGLVTGVTFNIGRRVLRRPINNFNRNIMKPLLGAGVKL